MQSKSLSHKVLLTVLWAVLGIAFFWCVIMKLIVKLGLDGGMPCPYALSGIVDNPIRRRYMQPVLDRVGILPGERVLELGPGPGAFTIDAAKRVGTDGSLIAVDIQPEMIAAVDAKVLAAGLTNVETRVASAYELPLEDSSMDRAYLITVLPEIPDQQQALAELYRVLKPGGILSITEEFLDPDYPLLATTRKHVEAAGFEFRERHGNWWCYTANFTKPSVAV